MYKESRQKLEHYVWRLQFLEFLHTLFSYKNIASATDHHLLYELDTNYTNIESWTVSVGVIIIGNIFYKQTYRWEKN